MIDIPLQLDRTADSTSRLLDTLDGLDDRAVAAPSQLPGWNRAQVITHLARNADAFAGMYSGARQGVVATMYPYGRVGRNADIDAGRHRLAARLAIDLRRAVDRLATEAGRLRAEEWQREGEMFTGRVALWETLLARRREVEVHHVDLGVGYTPGDWPADFVATELDGAASQLAARLDPGSAVRLVADDGAHWEAAGPGGRLEAATEVTGPAGQLLSWLLGRPTDLHPDPLPALRPWQ